MPEGSNSTACQWEEERCPYQWTMNSYNGSTTFSPNGSHSYASVEMGYANRRSGDVDDHTFTLEMFENEDCDEGGQSHEWSDCEGPIQNDCQQLSFNISSFRIRDNSGSDCPNASEADSRGFNLAASSATVLFVAAAAGSSLLL